MIHKLAVERIFPLGEYKNIKVIAESSDITDEEWSDLDKMSKIRLNLIEELLLNFSLHQEQTLSNVEAVKEGKWRILYMDLQNQRHELSGEVDSSAIRNEPIPVTYTELE